MKNTYNKVTQIDRKTLIVGIDIGKNNHYGFLKTMDYESSRSFRFSNSLQGFELLTIKIKGFISKNDIERVIVAVESTGNYWLPLAYYIQSYTEYTLVQVNGKHTKRLKDVTDNTPNKTDLKDPKVIAQVVLIGSGLNVNLPKGVKADLRELTRNRKALINDRKRSLNRLHAMLSMYFPELIDMFKDIGCKTSMYLLKNYSKPEDLVQATLTSLIKELRVVSRGRYGAEKVKDLISKTNNSIGIKEGRDAYQTIVGACIEQIETYDVQISIIEKQIKKLLDNLEEYIILKSIKGVGDITIATIISEVGDFSHFRANKQLLKFAGLNLVENSSGNHRGNKRISKVGNEPLRTSLYFLTLRLVKKGGIYHEQYAKYLNKGMEKKKAIIAISRKLLITIHAMIRNNKNFDISYYTEQMKTAA